MPIELSKSEQLTAIIITVTIIARVNKITEVAVLLIRSVKNVSDLYENEKIKLNLPHETTIKVYKQPLKDQNKIFLTKYGPDSQNAISFSETLSRYFSYVCMT